MRKFLLAATAAFTLPASSFAADVPMKAQPAGAAVFDWTGFYVGGHLGDGKWRTGDFHTEAHGTHPSSWVGGLHVGQNWQVGSIVYGYEGDLSAAWFHAGPFGSGMHLHTDLLGSLRGRLGLAFDRVLVYATGGLGYSHGKFSTSDLGVSNRFGKWGGVVGGGIEWAATQNLLWRVESLYYIFDKTLTNLDNESGKSKNYWVARVGVTYKFDSAGWGKGPVVAKY